MDRAEYAAQMVANGHRPRESGSSLVATALPCVGCGAQFGTSRHELGLSPCTETGWRVYQFATAKANPSGNEAALYEQSIGRAMYGD